MNFPPPTASQARLIWFSVTALAVALLLALGGLLVWGLGWVLNELSNILLPATFALILAYILDPVVEFLVLRKVPRRRAIVFVFLAGALLVMGTLGSVVPGVVRESRELVKELPAYAEKLRAKADALSEKFHLTDKWPMLSKLFTK